ncbi:methionine biosynthesis protein MetW [Gammaproteobacteria bacterium]|nr:methionine biosynthesis protein MetW [Gammaproteobacteria bacterium]
MSTLSVIEKWVEVRSKVLDLGCGNGNILSELQKTKDINGLGVEIEEKNIEECLLQNINVIEQNIDDGLNNFSSDSFDVVILSQTIQVLKNPDTALEEITRIGKTCIVTIPNFGHWRSRLSLLLNGRMPVTSPLPESWHATPNIHLCTLKDFEMLCSELLISIEERVTINSNNKSKWYLDIWPNLFSASAIYKISK